MANLQVAEALNDAATDDAKKTTSPHNRLLQTSSFVASPTPPTPTPPSASPTASPSPPPTRTAVTRRRRAPVGTRRRRANQKEKRTRRRRAPKKSGSQWNAGILTAGKLVKGEFKLGEEMVVATRSHVFCNMHGPVEEDDADGNNIDFDIRLMKKKSNGRWRNVAVSQSRGNNEFIRATRDPGTYICVVLSRGGSGEFEMYYAPMPLAPGPTALASVSTADLN